LGSAEHTASVFTGSGSFTDSVAKEGTIEAKMKLTDKRDLLVFIANIFSLLSISVYALFMLLSHHEGTDIFSRC
jgi:hypothetical protein